MSSSSAASPLPAREGGGGDPSRSLRVERSAGGVVVRVIEGEPHVLLIRDPYGKWGLPKGHLEGREEAPEAAMREVREETGLEALELGPDLGEIDWTFRLRGRRIHKFCRFYLMASRRGDLQPEVAEGITDCRWLPVDEAIRTIGYENARGVIVGAAERIQLPRDGAAPPWRVDPAS